MRRRLVCLTFLAAFASAPVLPVLAQDSTVHQGSNTSDADEAASGDASGGNSTEVGAGPSARQSDGGSSSSASMVGDTETVVTQRSEAESGPASAGSQLTGVGGGRGRPSSGDAGDGSGVQPGTSTDIDETSTGTGSVDQIQTPAPATQISTQPGGEVVATSSRTTGDWAATAAVLAVMVIGIAFGIHKLPDGSRSDPSELGRARP